jgi:16S rRNA (cytosine1402-N4)-methyltransferase
LLAVVTFHSLEDRIVKRFIQARSGNNPKGNRYAPETAEETATFERVGRKAIGPTDEEIEYNPRARSAKLRLARRLGTEAGEFSPHDIGLPKFDLERLV